MARGTLTRSPQPLGIHLDNRYNITSLASILEFVREVAFNASSLWGF